MEHSEAAPRIELGALHPDIQDSREWERVSPRQISPEQRQRFERYAAEMFEALGMRLDAPGTERTPERFIAAMLDATEGYEGDPKLVKAFPTECHGGPDCRISQVVEGPIPFHSLCEHHALPFYGHAYIGYIAHENIIGISKLTRLVRVFARRFSLQERIGHHVVETLDAMLQAHGVAVYLEAVHLCTQMRGVREVESRTRTSFWRGSYEEDPQLRAEFLSICGTRAA